MNKITLNGIEYVRATSESEIQELKKAKEELEWLKHEIQRNYDNAKLLVEDFKESGLTFNAVEAEGYLRASKTIYEQMKHIEENSGTEDW